MYKQLLSAALLLAPLPVMAQDNWIVGSWSLVSAVQGDKDYMGPKPLGQLIFGPDGRFSNVLMRSDIPAFQSGNRMTGTSDENKAVVQGSIAYYGTYQVTGNTLKMHLVASTYPNWNNTDQTRMVHLVDGQLSWENAAASAGGGGVKQMYERNK